MCEQLSKTGNIVQTRVGVYEYFTIREHYRRCGAGDSIYEHPGGRGERGDQPEMSVAEEENEDDET
jgi:hypothetical protein